MRAIAPHPAAVRTPRRPLAELARRHPVPLFTTLALAVTWLGWLPLLVERPARPIADSPWWPAYFLAMLGPSLAALAVSWAADGRAGAARWAARLDPRRAPVRWLVIAPLVPLALWAIAAGATWLAFDTPAPRATAFLRFDKLRALPPLLALAFLFATNCLGEEGGWRGFLLPELRRRHGALAATFLLVPIWLAWHAPVFVFDPRFAEVGVAGTAGWALSLTGGAVVFTWLWERSGGNAFVTALAHLGVNVVWMSAAAREPVGSLVGVLFTMLGVALLWPLARRGAPLGADDGRAPR